MQQMPKDKYLVAVLIITAASFLYWSLFGINAYNTFHEYEDLAMFEQSFYFNLHYPGIAHGLQLLVYGNHIVPLFLLIMPFFAIFQSPVTLLVIQAFVLSVAGIAVFYAAKYLLKSSKLGFGFALAYLLNPGMHGMFIFDFHAEAFISLFYILSFYYYIRARKFAFIVAFALLMCTMEVTPTLGIVLGIGLFIFEFRSKFEPENAKKRKKLAVYAILISIAFFMLYAYISAQLAFAYQNKYPGLPENLYLTTGSQNTLGSMAIISFSNVSEVLKLDYYSYSDMVGYLIFALLIVFFGYGIAAFGAPIESLIMSLPWLFMVFVIINTAFVLTWFQYFGFVVGPMAVASMLGAERIIKRRGVISRLLLWLSGNQKELLYYMLVLVPIFLFAISPAFFYSRNLNNFSEDLFFMPNSTVIKADSQLESIIHLVPGNASVDSQPFINAHLANRAVIGLGNNYTTWPEYIITDFNQTISLNSVTNPQYSTFSNFIATHPYRVVASNGTAVLYRKI